MPQSALEQTNGFLDWLFGSSEETHIYLFALKGSKEKNNYDTRHVYTQNPTETIGHSWMTSIVPSFNAYYCTSRVKNRLVSRNGSALSAKARTEAASVPALWFDIDACRKFLDPRTQSLLVPGDEFYQDLRIQFPEVSAWIRSSEDGIQGLFKLDEPFEVNGDESRFEGLAQPILYDIVWFFGADFAVTPLSSLMRLPGTCNVKYKPSYPVTCEIFEDRVHSLKSLSERFKPDFDATPRIVAYALIKLMQELWIEGERNQVALKLAGSLRFAGIDRKSAKRFFRELCKALHDDSDDKRASEVDSTYDRDIAEGIATISTDYKEMAPVLHDVLAFWLKQKAIYAKKSGLDWQPENIDPTAPLNQSKGNKQFWEHDGATWYLDKDGEPRVAGNFTLKIVRRIVKYQDNAVDAHAIITRRGGQPTLIEMTAATHNSFQKFSTIRPVPAGVQWLARDLWAEFMVQVDTDATDVPVIRELQHYGIVGKDPVSLFLPGQESDDYLWATDMKVFDTAQEGALTKELTRSQVQTYLRGLQKYLPYYHEPSYVWTALGWFVASSLTQIFRDDPRIEGFPVLHITGNAGAGKSTLVNSVLGPHYGCRPPRSLAKKATTPFALKVGLGSNNVCPYLSDELRDEDDDHTLAIQNLMRNSWKGYDTESGLQSGKVRRDALVSPWVVIGESSGTDKASLDRTLSIRVLPTWVRKMRKADADTKTEFDEGQQWLHDSKWTGYLGSTVLKYVGEHLTEMTALIGSSIDKVKKSSSVQNERKQKNFVVALTGLRLLRLIYADYGVPFPLSNTDLLPALYNADLDVMNDETPETATLKQLFEATDYAIVDALRHRTSLEGTMYILDPSDTGVIYFQHSRWFGVISTSMKFSQSPALKNARGFNDMLRENMESEKPVVLEFDSKAFKYGTIKCDLNRIGELFRLDTDTWLKRVGEE